ncbi:hypothetical protein B0A48_06600 [Cryoendolithus antarcticus]|uniref:Kinesin-like protein n=1 Tax=Cryoendolithus antarcticus TaxID=1507870 RepID=A0A1V8T8Y1_9PEZI|nr:hypothetical protein B0A48_06600 [Cryoendolithus antarcticus]
MDPPPRPSASLFDVYLRLRPSNTAEHERFLQVEAPSTSNGPTHITVQPPANDPRKRAIEKFAFTRVFEEDAGQLDLFRETGAVQMVEGVLGAKGREGRDALVATLGVTGSGKSHTILGDKAQRGLTQLTLDLLFQHTVLHLAPVDTSAAVFPSLCAADVSEAQLMPAAHFLDNIYDETHGRASRATTPAIVRDSAFHTTAKLPGAFPMPQELVPAKKTTQVFDRLYPSLSKYQIQQPATSPAPALKSPSRFAHLTRSIAKLTSPFQDTSFLSTAQTSRKYVPRLSALPQYPSVDDIELEVDTTCEYAIVVSMYEVYNDKIHDLLTASAGAMKAMQKRRALLYQKTELSPDRKVVAGLRKVVCSDLDEALLVLETGLQERRVAGTGSNATSSRSHGFFCIEVKKRHRASIPGPWSSSTFTIVDLAGSERARTAKTTGTHLAEAGKINGSLMYLGQCMELQSELHRTTTSAIAVPYRNCKLTELLFTNFFAPSTSTVRRQPQKAVMIVTADPGGDFNATGQILRYSALAKNIVAPRVPSTTSTILAGTNAPPSRGGANSAASGRTSPSTSSATTVALHDELATALAAIASLRQDLEITVLELQHERLRRGEAEENWQAAVLHTEEVEAEVREEVWAEMEARLVLEQRRWRAARDAEVEAGEAVLDAKISVLVRGLEEGGEADKENVAVFEDEGERMRKLEDEVGMLKGRLRESEEAGSRSPSKETRSPSKKMRVLKSRRWDGSGMGIEEGW